MTITWSDTKLRLLELSYVAQLDDVSGRRSSGLRLYLVVLNETAEGLDWRTYLVASVDHCSQAPLNPCGTAQAWMHVSANFFFLWRRAWAFLRRTTFFFVSTCGAFTSSKDDYENT